MADENEVLPGDIDQVLGNYRQRHANGESYLDMAKQVEEVADKRLGAVLRKLHRGKDPQARTAPPEDRTPPGNKAVTASEDSGKGK
jgi:hypothetical protein